MIKGINGHPYFDLDRYLDIEGFIKLHAEMSKGIVLSKYKKEGNIVKPSGAMEPGSWEVPFKPSCVALEEYYRLPEDDPIRVAGRELGEMDNRDQFIQYLKLVLGGYDAYQFVFLKTEDGGWETRFDEKAWTPDAEHFPRLKLWLENLVAKEFLHISEGSCSSNRSMTVFLYVIEIYTEQIWEFTATEHTGTNLYIFLLTVRNRCICGILKQKKKFTYSLEPAGSTIRTGTVPKKVIRRATDLG